MINVKVLYILLLLHISLSPYLAIGVVCHAQETLSDLHVAAVKEILQLVACSHHEFLFPLLIAHQLHRCPQHHTHHNERTLQK